MDTLSFRFWFANRKLFFTKLLKMWAFLRSLEGEFCYKKMDADENDD